MAYINDEQRIGQTGHVLDAAQTALQLLHIPAQPDHFFFAQAFKSAVLSLQVQILEPLNGLANGFEVGQHPAQPAVIDIGHAAANSRFGC